MSVERRFLTGMREGDTDEPGLVLEDDGTIEVVAPGGTRRSLSDGGTGALRDVDLGIVDFAEVFANGPTTLYEMQPGEFLKEIKFTDLDFEAIDSPVNPQEPSVEVYFGIGTIKSFQWYSFAQIARTSGQPATDAVDTVGLYINPNFPAFGAVYGPELGSTASKAMVLSAAAGGDIQAAIGVGNGDPEGFRVDAITGWLASTDYFNTLGHAPTANVTPRRCAVLEDGTVWWNVGAADQSGLVKPDFPSRPLNGIDEGDILWSDSTLAPTTTGKVHAVATISAPGT